MLIEVVINRVRCVASWMFSIQTGSVICFGGFYPRNSFSFLSIGFGFGLALATFEPLAVRSISNGNLFGRIGSVCQKLKRKRGVFSW